MIITIGIDPHKATHTAVAIDTKEAVVGEHKVRASAAQAAALIDWAQGFVVVSTQIGPTVLT